MAQCMGEAAQPLEGRLVGAISAEEFSKTLGETCHGPRADG